MSGLRFGLVGLFMLILPALLWGQSQTDLSVVLQNGPVYPPGRWIPAFFTAKNESDRPVDGRVATQLKTDSGEYEIAYPIFVPPRSVVRGEMLVNLKEPPPLRRPTDKSPPAAEFFWRSADNAELDREPVYASADSAAITTQDQPTGIAGVQILYLTENDDYPETSNPNELRAILNTQSAFRYSFSTTSVTYLTHRSVALDAVRLIVLDQSSVDRLDPGQRDALLLHVHGGATLLVIAHDASIAGTWVGRYLPMDLIGQRESSTVQTTEKGVVKLRQALLHHVAVAREGATVVLSTAENTLAAYRPVGLGRVAMMGLPANAIDPTDPGIAEIWSSLIGVSRQAFHDPIAFSTMDTHDASESEDSLVGMLPSVVGATAPPWKTAALISLIYTGAVAGVLLMIGAKYRPLAIVGCVAAGVIIAAGVLGINAIKSSDQPLMLAQLSVVDVEGNAMRRQEIATFFGQQRDADINFTVAPTALPTAVVTAGSTPPLVRIYPFTVKNVSSSTGTYASIWNIRSQATLDHTNIASLAFGPDGAKLHVNPAQPLTATRLLNGGSVFPTGDFSAGDQSVGVTSRNAPGEWGSGGRVISNEQSKLQTEILIRTEGRRDPNAGIVRRTNDLKLVGYASQGDTLLKTGESVDERGLTLMRMGVEIAPSPVGSEVRIDPGFTQIRKDAAISLPYMPLANYWNDSTPGGPWLIGIAAPQEIGKLQPRQLTLNVHFRSEGYDLTLQRGQVSGGKVRESASGEVILQWGSGDSQKSATIDLTPNDIDQNGWVWIRLSANQLPSGESLIGSLAGGASTSTLNWRIMRFDATLNATVASPPQPIVRTWRLEREDRPIAPKPPATPKPAPKPATKPAAKPK